ncbi:hypothetical protein P9112_004873 [Eukaryota sp. TZLM1-RC]
MLPSHVSRVKCTFSQGCDVTVISGPLGGSLCVAAPLLSKECVFSIDIRDDCHVDGYTLIISSLECCLVSTVKTLDYTSTPNSTHALLLDSSSSENVYNTASSLLTSILAPSKIRIVKGSRKAADLTLTELWRHLAIHTTAIPVTPLLSLPKVAAGVRNATDIPSALSSFCIKPLPVSLTNHSTSYLESTSLRLNINVAQSTWMTLKLYEQIIHRNLLSGSPLRFTVSVPRLCCNATKGCGVRLGSFLEAKPHVDSGHVLSCPISMTMIQIVSKFSSPLTVLQAKCGTFCLGGTYSNHVILCATCQKSPEVNEIDLCDVCWLPLVLGTCFDHCKCTKNKNRLLKYPRKIQVKQENTADDPPELPATTTETTTCKKTLDIDTSSNLNSPRTPLVNASNQEFRCYFCSSCSSISDVYNNHFESEISQLPPLIVASSFSCPQCREAHPGLSGINSHLMSCFESSEGKDKVDPLDCLMVKCLACGVLFGHFAAIRHAASCLGHSSSIKTPIKTPINESIKTPINSAIKEVIKEPESTTSLSQVKEESSIPPLKKTKVESSSDSSTETYDSIDEYESYSESESDSESESESESEKVKDKVINKGQKPEDPPKPAINCMFCKLVFPSEYAMSRHLLTRHKKELIISVTDLSVYHALPRAMKSLLSKSRYDPFRCLLCDPNAPPVSNCKLPSERMYFKKLIHGVIHLTTFHPDFKYNNKAPLLQGCSCRCKSVLFMVDDFKSHFKNCEEYQALMGSKPSNQSNHQSNHQSKDVSNHRSDRHCIKCCFCSIDVARDQLVNHVAKVHPNKIVESVASPALAIPELLAKFVKMRVDRAYSRTETLFDCSLCSNSKPMPLFDGLVHLMSHGTARGKLLVTGSVPKFSCTLCNVEFDTIDSEPLIDHFKTFHRMSV